MLVASSVGWTRSTSRGAAQLSRTTLSWLIHAEDQPATLGWAAAWREGWSEKPRSGLISASQRAGGGRVHRRERLSGRQGRLRDQAPLGRQIHPPRGQGGRQGLPHPRRWTGSWLRCAGERTGPAVSKASVSSLSAVARRGTQWYRWLRTVCTAVREAGPCIVRQSALLLASLLHCPAAPLPGVKTQG